MIRNFDKNVDDLVKNGFTNINNFFPKEKIQTISSEIDKVFKNDRNNKEEGSNSPEKKQKKIYLKKGNITNLNSFTGPILGKSKLIDNFISELFENKEFRNLCEKLVGKNYKIYTLHFRELNNSTNYLGLHQDAYYQASFQIPLNDISKNDSATCFVNGSHLSKFQLLDQLLSIAGKISSKFFSFCTKKYQCQVGDFGIFFNKTFHGNEIKKSGLNKSGSILIALSAEGGYKHTPWEAPTKTDYNEDFKTSVGDYIYQKMFSTNDLIKVDDYFFTHSNDVPKNPKINKIATSSSGVSMMTIFDKAPLHKRHLLDKIIFDDFKLSLRTKLVTFYIKTILKVKNLIKGKF